MGLNVMHILTYIQAEGDLKDWDQLRRFAGGVVFNTNNMTYEYHRKMIIVIFLPQINIKDETQANSKSQLINA